MHGAAFRSRDIRQGGLGVNTNRKDLDKSAQVYSMIRSFATLSYVP